MKKKISLAQLQRMQRDYDADKDNQEMKAIGMPFHTPVAPTQLSLKLDDHYGKPYTDPNYRYDDDPDFYTTFPC